MAKLKLTKELTKKICKLLEKGNTVETSCALNDICKNTYYDWIKQSKEDNCKEIFTYFSDAINKAHSKYKQKKTAQLENHFKDPKNASQIIKWLQIKFPQEYKEVKHLQADVEMQAELTGEFTVDHTIYNVPNDGRGADEIEIHNNN